MRFALAFLTTTTLAGDIRVLATPEPMEVVRSVGLRGLGLWSVIVCNDAAVPVTLPRERLQLALPQVRMVATERARAVLLDSSRRTPQARLVRILRYALVAAAISTGLARASPQLAGGLAAGSAVADEIADRIERELPTLDPWTVGLNSEAIRLDPGACTTRTAFAALQRGAHPMEAVIR